MYFNDNDNYGDLTSNKLLNELSKIAYVPVLAPVSKTCMLVQWSEVALYKDRHLIWTHKSVLPEELEPPRQVWESLLLSNRQEPLEVLMHLRNICDTTSIDTTNTSTNGNTSNSNKNTSLLFQHNDKPTDIISSILIYLFMSI